MANAKIYSTEIPDVTLPPEQRVALQLKQYQLE
jgi:hypothetical protein